MNIMPMVSESRKIREITENENINVLLTTNNVTTFTCPVNKNYKTLKITLKITHQPNIDSYKNIEYIHCNVFGVKFELKPKKYKNYIFASGKINDILINQNSLDIYGETNNREKINIMVHANQDYLFIHEITQ